MAEACKEAQKGIMTLEQSVQHMASKVLNAVESTVIESCYDFLQLPITYS